MKHRKAPEGLVEETTPEKQAEKPTLEELLKIIKRTQRQVAHLERRLRQAESREEERDTKEQKRIKEEKDEEIYERAMTEKYGPRGSWPRIHAKRRIWEDNNGNQNYPENAEFYTRDELDRLKASRLDS